MSHTTTITTGGGIVQHHYAIATEPGFRVQILEFNDSKAPKLILHEKLPSIFSDIKMSWLR